MSGRGGNGGVGVQLLPAASRKMVQSLKEIVNCPESEIYAMLKESNIDPNVTVNRLLSEVMVYTIVNCMGWIAKPHGSWHGPPFRIPVTITKAMAVKNRPALVSLAGMSFLPEEVLLDGSEAPVRIDAKALLALRSYKFKLVDGAEVKPQIPLLNNCIYDNKFESQFYVIYDASEALGTVEMVANLVLSNP
ncbi:hypothetical protein RHSIM_RhsimUnG0162600 [Rhododendron simsii]|uniref:Uncharacterized protein n=1 Tax=Rhododendron simsii TaxID=118357 RepID=A0A834FVE8_RHOSS|nr:hypothetical protein RHSIM_RhsimUnG0162600 [Rhododendron simsii]